VANTIRLKRRAAGGASGAPASLASAEPAYNEQDDTLYYGKGDSSGVATSIIPIGGKGAFVDLSGAQSISGVKTFGSSPVVPTPATGDNSTNAASTAFVKAQGYLTGNQSITLSGDITGAGATAIVGTLATVNSNVGTFTKVTVNGKGLITAATNLLAADIPTLTASKISDFDAQVRTSRLDQLAAPTADVSLNSRKITNVADPVSAQDAATKSYVDGVAQGLDAKHSVRAATTANITLAGAQTVDGVSVVAGDRVLVKNQSSAAQNGSISRSLAPGRARSTWTPGRKFRTPLSSSNRERRKPTPAGSAPLTPAERSERLRSHGRNFHQRAPISPAPV